MSEFNARVVESEFFGAEYLREEESEDFAGLRAQALHPSSGIVVGLMLGAGAWLVLGGLIALVRVSLF